MTRALGMNATEIEVRQAVAEHSGGDGGDAVVGKVSLEAFLAILARFAVLAQQDTLPELRHAFDVLDADHDGLLSVEEVRHVFGNVGERLSPEEIDDMFAAVDLNHDGRITFEEFERLVGQH